LLDWGPGVAVGANINFVRVFSPLAELSTSSHGARLYNKPPSSSSSSTSSEIVSWLVFAAARFISLATVNPVLRVTRHLGWGSSGGCWLGSLALRDGGNGATVAIKLAWPGTDNDALRQEAAIYTHVLPFAKGLRRPQFHGYFHGADRHAIVLQYTGEPIDSFDSLSLDEK
jgi:hypothetical protein